MLHRKLPETLNWTPSGSTLWKFNVQSSSQDPPGLTLWINQACETRTLFCVKNPYPLKISGRTQVTLQRITVKYSHQRQCGSWQYKSLLQTPSLLNNSNIRSAETARHLLFMLTAHLKSYFKKREREKKREIPFPIPLCKLLLKLTDATAHSPCLAQTHAWRKTNGLCHLLKTEIKQLFLVVTLCAFDHLLTKLQQR